MQGSAAGEKKVESSYEDKFQMFQLAAIVSLIDHLRFRMNHLEVSIKGEKAGPYELSEIPPALSVSQALDSLERIWKGWIGEGPVSDELLTGVAKTEAEKPAEAKPAAPAVPVPGIDTEAAFELESSNTRASASDGEEQVLTLEADAVDEDDEDSGVFELEQE